MTFAALLDQTITVHRTTATTRDLIGARVIDTENTVNVDAYVFPVTGEEDRTNRNTKIGTWRALIPFDTDVDGWDRITWDGRTFDIIAVEPKRNPRTHAGAHIRLELEEVV